jgi:transcription elongation factor Elf1
VRAAETNTMESTQPVNCPKCGRNVADAEIAANLGGETVLCKSCGALVSLRDSTELEAKGEMDSEFDLAICFEPPAGSATPTTEPAATSSPATAAESEQEAAAEEAEVSPVVEPEAQENLSGAGK